VRGRASAAMIVGQPMDRRDAWKVGTAKQSQPERNERSSLLVRKHDIVRHPHPGGAQCAKAEVRRWLGAMPGPRGT
jgi:hypothetical protein